MTSLSESRSELDAITADIELTLVSIIQGVALTVLIETSREVIARLDWMMCSPVQFDISGFGFEMQDLSDLAIPSVIGTYSSGG